MSSARKDLVKLAIALVDSHLSIRKNEWKLIDEAGSIQLPAANTTAHGKLHIWLKFQQALKQINPDNIDQWIEMACDLYRVQKEQSQGDYSYFIRAGLSMLRITNWQLLSPHTAEAVRDLIIDAIKDDPQYKFTHSELVKQISTLENAIKVELNQYKKDSAKEKQEALEKLNEKLYALTDNKQYYRSFFDSFIKLYDHRALSETSYDDFIANVLAGSRKPDITDAVLKALEIDKQNKVSVYQADKAPASVVSGSVPSAAPIAQPATLVTPVVAPLPVAAQPVPVAKSEPVAPQPSTSVGASKPVAIVSTSAAATKSSVSVVSSKPSVKPAAPIASQDFKTLWSDDVGGSSYAVQPATLFGASSAQKGAAPVERDDPSNGHSTRSRVKNARDSKNADDEARDVSHRADSAQSKRRGNRYTKY